MLIPQAGMQLDNPAMPLLQALISYWRVTTAAGAATGLTFIDANLVNEPSYEGHAVTLLGSTAWGQVRNIVNNGALGVQTVDRPFTDNTGAVITVPAGTPFVILSVGSGGGGAGIGSLIQVDGTVTLDGAEQDIYLNNAPASTFRPIQIKIDFSNQTVAETVVLRTYYRIIAGGNLVLQDQVTYGGIQTPALKNISLEANRYGVQVTIQRTAGGNIAYDWELIYQA